MSILPINEITKDIKEFDFAKGINDLGLDAPNCQFLRKKAHLQLVFACSHAVYFVGVANRIRRNIHEIKSGVVKTKNSILINQVKRTPGLQIGIIGCGKLGRHLAKCLMEFSEVYPNELQISTRQPDSLVEFKNLNVKCCFDNARVASSVNILFLCILPSQLTNVIQDIKPYLTDKCIIYSFVTSASLINLKNFLPDCMCRNFMLKPSYTFTKNISEIDNKLKEKWNFSQNVTDCLRNMDMVKITDPFLLANDSIYSLDEFQIAAFVYSFVNMCSFMSLSKAETTIALRNYLFRPTNDKFKLEESYFYESLEMQNDSISFPLIEVTTVSSKQTPVSNKYLQSKSFRKFLSKNFVYFFEESLAWKIRNKQDI